MSEAAEAESCEQVRALLGRQMRVVTDDQREFIGMFTCLDDRQNIILKHVKEFRKWDGRLELVHEMTRIIISKAHTHEVCISEDSE